eukprot:m.77445 g.77445  ORF g.77445 m.77445 type:complete len:138 (-) comp19112_c1_seq2:221-634(-)
MRCEVGLRLALLAVACVAIQLEEPRWNDPLLSQLKESGFRPATIVDCGANRGDWALWARYLWPDAAILMVEANPHLKKDLDAVVQKVGNAEAVTAVLTESPGQVSGGCQRLDPTQLESTPCSPARIQRLDSWLFSIG